MRKPRSKVWKDTQLPTVRVRPQPSSGCSALEEVSLKFEGVIVAARVNATASGSDNLQDGKPEGHSG